MLGWLDLPSSVNEDLIKSINDAAVRLSRVAEIFVVVGIGGSYLGARALIDALNHTFAFEISDKKAPFVVYAGHNMSSDYLAGLLDLLDKKEYAIAVISKSGTTTEPAIAFRILKGHLEKKYGMTEARKRIVAVTDGSKGVLRKMAVTENYERYIIPDDIGGRFSVFSPVGLLPVAVSGFDIDKLIAGARQMEAELKKTGDPVSNPAALYACARQACYRSGFSVELFASYEPCLHYLAEWWKQLFGESEGKQHKGIFPAAVSFTTDLHSLGQYIQEGSRMIFETIISIDKTRNRVVIPMDSENTDGLNFLAGKDLSEINQMAELGTVLAHTDGYVPNIRISIPAADEYFLGQLMYFFEFSCALSAYMFGVNPFDQPGVEAYKNNMFALLKKPGYEKQTTEINKKLRKM